MRSLVVALNPSIDFEWRVDKVRWEEKNLVRHERRWAGGKGVNVARWLKHLGGKPRLLLPLGGRTGRELAGYLRAERLTTRIIPLREPTRVNVIISAAADGQLRFNPPGPKLSTGEWSNIVTHAVRELKRSVVLVLSGSLPRGVPVTAYARLIRLAREAGVKALLDCDGPAFAAALKSKPFLVKPNVHELAEWWGRPLRSLRSLQRAARALSDTTGGWVLVSRGDQGALLIHSQRGESFCAPAPRVAVHNTVGAGDALLAAVARQVECNRSPEEWLQCGVAAGSAATQCAAGVLPGPVVPS